MCPVNIGHVLGSNQSLVEHSLHRPAVFHYRDFVAPGNGHAADHVSREKRPTNCKKKEKNGRSGGIQTLCVIVLFTVHCEDAASLLS